MHIVHVFIHVKPDCLAAFQAATLANARASLREPGVARFDVIQQADAPDRFVAHERWRDLNALGDHLATPHFAAVGAAIGFVLERA